MMRMATWVVVGSGPIVARSRSSATKGQTRERPKLIGASTMDGAWRAPCGLAQGSAGWQSEWRLPLTACINYNIVHGLVSTRVMMVIVAMALAVFCAKVGDTPRSGIRDSPKRPHIKVCQIM